MKYVLPIAAMACAACLAGCETTNSNGGNQEAKRHAAIERQKQQPPPDEAQANLWGARRDWRDQDSNPLRAY
jgi:hypothetical protein